MGFTLVNYRDPNNAFRTFYISEVFSCFLLLYSQVWYLIVLIPDLGLLYFYREFIVLLFRELGENMTDEELRAMIDEFDRDGDGESMLIMLKNFILRPTRFRNIAISLASIHLSERL